MPRAKSQKARSRSSPMAKKSKASQSQALTEEFLAEIIFPEPVFPTLHEFDAKSLVPKGAQSNGTIARPLNSFLIFRQRYSVQLTEANPQKIVEVQRGPKRLVLLSKLVSRKWYLMKKEGGEPYKFFKAAAQRVKEEHARHHPDYIFNPKHRKAATTKQSDSTGLESTHNKTTGAAKKHASQKPSLSSVTAHVSVQPASTAEAEEQESPCGEGVEANECREEQVDGQLSHIVSRAGLNEAIAQDGYNESSHRATDPLFSVFDSTSNSFNEHFASAKPGKDMMSHLGQGPGSHTSVFPGTGFIQPSIPTAGGFYDRYTLPMPYPYQPHGYFHAYQRGPGPLDFSHLIDPLLHAPTNMGNGYDVTYSMGELPMNYTNGMMYASGSASTQPPPSLYSPTSLSTYSPVSDSSAECLTPFAAAMHWTNQV